MIALLISKISVAVMLALLAAHFIDPDERRKTIWFRWILLVGAVAFIADACAVRPL